MITSIDGEIDILNADISVTTPFLAATNITAHNISAVNEIQALSINASNIVAESSFSVLSDTLSTSFYTDFVDDQKFVLKVTGVSGSFSTAPAPSPKLAFRTGSTDALLITESGNVSIGAKLTATNISANVLHSPVIVSNLITSIDGEIEILNADISVTTPFLAATDIISTNGTFSSLVTDNLIVSGNILNTGNIQNNKFKVTQVVTRLGNIFGGTGEGEITIANNVGCSGGTLIFYISCTGFATNGGLYSYLIRYKNAQGVTRATISAPFFFNQTSVHHAWGITQRFTGIPAANMLVSIQRSSTNLRMNVDDFLTIVMEELPY